MNQIAIYVCALYTYLPSLVVAIQSFRCTNSFLPLPDWHVTIWDDSRFMYWAFVVARLEGVPAIGRWWSWFLQWNSSRSFSGGQTVVVLVGCLNNSVEVTQATGCRYSVVRFHWWDQDTLECATSTGCCRWLSGHLSGRFAVLIASISLTHCERPWSNLRPLTAAGGLGRNVAVVCRATPYRVVCPNWCWLISKACELFEQSRSLAIGRRLVIVVLCMRLSVFADEPSSWSSL